MAKRESLTVEVSEDLRRKISDGLLPAGEKIKTETELCHEYEVSRTVIREAIARLRSDGLVNSRQGVGVFVTDRTFIQSFEVDWAAIGSLPETIELLELRMAVEVESAGLCAARRTEAEAAEIRGWMRQTDMMPAELDTVNALYDFDFHIAIAKASRNGHIHRFMRFLKPVIVPRVKLSELVDEEMKRDYYATIHDEHDRIVTAIEDGEPAEARDAMRAHLHNSVKRVQDLAATYGLDRVSKHDVAMLGNFFRTISSRGKS